MDIKQAIKAAGSVVKYGDESLHIDHQVKSLEVKYACPICREVYDHYPDAEQCAVQPFNEAGVQAGDIFIIPNSNSYHAPTKGYEHWCAFSIEGDETESSHFDHVKQWFPYWVVTAIQQDHRDPHRCVVTVASLFAGKLWAGWNPADGNGHHAMFKPGEADHSKQRSDIGSTWWSCIRNGVSMADRFASAQPSDKLLVEAKELVDLKVSTRSLL